MLNRSTQSGFTLVELMISIVLSMIVVLGTVNLYLTIVKGGKDVYDRNRLTQELRTISATLAKDVRRAGYWEAVMGVDDIWLNPFTTGGNDIAVGARTGEAANSCILYSYDMNLDGAVDDPADRFGFRLNTGAVQMYTSGTFSCDNGTWETITTPEVSITNLSFALSETCMDVATESAAACPCTTGSSCQHIRRVAVGLAGQLAADAAINEALSESIRIRNDKFVLTVP